MDDTAWTRRRFLGALVASAVAAGVKIPGIPAADGLARYPHTPWGYSTAILDADHACYWLIIPPGCDPLQAWERANPGFHLLSSDAGDPQ
jgi:hypothetical protein